VASRVEENNVIDNKKVFLKNELISILPQTKDASIAVGYFFISGLSVIAEQLRHVDKVRLLISNTTDQKTAETLLSTSKSTAKVCDGVAKTNFVNQDRNNTVKLDMSNNMKESLELMHQTESDKNVVQTLIDMINKHQLEVRVYPKEKLHAKAYIFKPKDPSFASGMGIVGSSNLSMAGISENSELNLKTHNTSDVNKLLDWFNNLWKDGLEVTDDFNVIMNSSWAGQTYSPRILFLKAIYHEFRDRVDPKHIPEPLIDSNKGGLFPFQQQAVDQCVTMIEQYGGVIIGDVVGLGKTYVGTALLKYLQHRDYRPLIVCPPALQNMWEEFCAEFEVNAKVISRGDLTSRDYDLFRDYRFKDRDLVLIDESHHFKNNNTRQYTNLHDFMLVREAKGILLTATPYSNDITDVQNQIMLFHQSTKTKIPPAADIGLDAYFVKVRNKEANPVDLLRNIMIRRTRRYILKQYGKEDEQNPKRKYLQINNKQRMYFPEREMKTCSYDINEVYQNNYVGIVSKLDKNHLTLARYSPGSYLKDEHKTKPPYSELYASGPSLVKLIRILLLKRMESSLQAFQDTVQRYIQTHTLFLDLLAKGIMPIGDHAGKEIYEASDPESDFLDDPDELKKIADKIKAGKRLYDFNAFWVNDLKRDITNDLEIFKDIMRLLSPITHGTDHKLIQLQTLLDKHNDKKVIVFTEFVSTAEYLYKYTRWDKYENVEIVTSNRRNAMSAARRFDPIHNFHPKKLKNNDVPLSLLISTDVLSEGINLQAGQVVINYDFHWNPVRLIQRVGRVDRIGSEHASIIVYNFLPDPTIEKDLRLEKHVDSKIDEIQKVIGEDYAVLKQDEIINKEDMYAIYDKDPSILDRENENPLEPSKFEQTLIDVQTKQPDFYSKFLEIPDGIRSSFSKNSGGKLIMACQNIMPGNRRVTKYYVIDSTFNVKTIETLDMLKLLESNNDQNPELPPNYEQFVSAGWEAFINELEQIDANEDFLSRLTNSQQLIIQRLIQISHSTTQKIPLDKIDLLRRAFTLPILKGGLRRELNKISDMQLDDSDLVSELEKLYNTFNLKVRLEENENEAGVPRILYSMYVGE